MLPCRESKPRSTAFQTIIQTITPPMLLIYIGIFYFILYLHKKQLNMCRFIILMNSASCSENGICFLHVDNLQKVQISSKLFGLHIGEPSGKISAYINHTLYLSCGNHTFFFAFLRPNATFLTDMIYYKFFCSSAGFIGTDWIGISIRSRPRDGPILI